jgi:hypothetical protein
MCLLRHFLGRMASLQPPPNFERRPGRGGADGGWDTVRKSLTPPTKEEMEELGPSFVGRWESGPTRQWFACFPLDFDARFNTYAPKGGSDAPYTSDAETDVVCCWCVGTHVASTSVTSDSGLAYQETAHGPNSFHLMRYKATGHASDASGRRTVTYEGIGQAGDNQRISAVSTYAFDKFGDASMTWEQTAPSKMKVTFRKVSRFPDERMMSDKFARKKNEPSAAKLGAMTQSRA